jgi:hypothetical protein
MVASSKVADCQNSLRFLMRLGLLQAMQRLRGFHSASKLDISKR